MTTPPELARLACPRPGLRFALAASLAIVSLLLNACSFYAVRSGKSSYRPPDKLVVGAGSGERSLVVVLIPGSMIVADFFAELRDRLEREGFRPVVFQPPDLFTDSLEVGAQRIGAAIEAVRRTAGVDRVVILAECNGGVAARYYVERQGGNQFVARLVTFVSAHHGTEAVGVRWYPALADIKPGSAFLAELAGDWPAALDTTLVSIYFCDDEIMKPATTSRIPGAVNVEICDPEIRKRAKERPRQEVDHFLGAMLLRLYPVHFAGFWDDSLFRLFVSCLRDEPKAIRELDLVRATFPQ
ncbi:MAG: hypothetical protein HYV63_18580 [Candidatus Schekmanbacteria bacterium]|nr:hypothetical protein [Candidatus Schekmanbacteria bacterium]